MKQYRIDPILPCLITVTQLRKSAQKILRQVRDEGERIFVTINSQPVAAIIPIAEVEHYKNAMRDSVMKGDRYGYLR